MNKYITLAIALAITSAECFARGGSGPYHHGPITFIDKVLFVVIGIPVIATFYFMMIKNCAIIVKDAVVEALPKKPVVKPVLPEQPKLPVPAELKNIKWNRFMRIAVTKQSEDRTYTMQPPNRWIIRAETTYEQNLENILKQANGHRSMVEILPSKGGLHAPAQYSFEIN